MNIITKAVAQRNAPNAIAAIDRDPILLPVVTVERIIHAHWIGAQTKERSDKFYSDEYERKVR